MQPPGAFLLLKISVSEKQQQPEFGVKAPLKNKKRDFRFLIE